ncbi:MAG: methyltransferase family protein [Dissulfurispiraceae bacterium]
MTQVLALLTVIFWVLIPVFWIPVHYATNIFRQLGLLTYALLSITWLPIAFLIFQYKDILLQMRIDLPLAIKVSGAILLALGTLLHMWSGRLLSFLGIIGVPEIYHKVKGHLATKGAFSVVRHPTYLAHTLMFSGVFLFTGVIAVGLITMLDFLLVRILIIPLEERELLRRFGDEYNQYQKKVPQFFPEMHPYR